MPLTFAETPLYYKDAQGNYHRILSGADMTGYRTAAAQDVIDAAQDADIASRAKADEIGIVITGARPSMAVSAGQYVIVRGSTIAGITDGLYTAAQAIPANTAIDATYLTAVTSGGLNSIKQHLEWQLLWENPNTFLEFAASNIQLNLLAYTEIRVVVKQYTDSTRFLTFEGLVGDTIYAEITGIFTYSGIMRLNRRSFETSALGVNISDGEIKEFTATDKTTSNGQLIPYRIFAR